MGLRTLARSFSGGEVTPEFFGQFLDGKFQTGLAKCLNFEVLPHGPIRNRAGFEFVREVKTSTEAARLIPFTYSTTQTMVLCLNGGNFRFHTQGATLESSPGVAYEVTMPYVAADLFTINYVQSSDVLTLVHTLYAPRELRRAGALSWNLTTISFTTPLLPPTGVTVVGTIGATPGPSINYTYAVTTVGEGAQEESLLSGADTDQNNLFDQDAYNTVTWVAAASAVRYNVYKFSGGFWGYIGQSDSLSFKDDNIAADIGKTPPLASNPFVGAGNYPGAVSYFEQRRVFAGTLNKPQNIWMTKPGTETNLNYSIPGQDSDGIAFRVVAREANTVRHLVPLTNLMAMTSAAEWRLTSINTDAITPSSVSVKPQSYVGAGPATPQIVKNNIIFAAARGGHLMEMAYSLQGGGYVTGDLCLRAPHLFDGFDIVDMAYSKSPHPIIWAVSTSGKLLGVTYVPEQQIGAIHQHKTDGVFESIAVVAEGATDVLYAVIRRTIGGSEKRYVERMRPRVFADQEDAFFVDSGLTYDGAPTLTISGLTHLNGKTVSILADGAVMAPRVVVGGSIALDIEASVVQVGLAITADAQTLPLAFEVQGVGALGQGRMKNVNKVFLRVKDSSGIFAGPSFEKLREFKQRTDEEMGTPPALRTDEIGIDVTPSWGNSAQVCIRQSDPLPLTIVSMTLDVAIGG